MTRRINVVEITARLLTVDEHGDVKASWTCRWLVTSEALVLPLHVLLRLCEVDRGGGEA